MPKEHRKRGRRAEKKRKAEKEREETELQIIDDAQQYDDYAGGGGDFGGDEANTFYGLLTDEETEYFKRADELLEINDFAGGDEERKIFIENLYKEVAGKELKIIHSQGCSRLMERLICTSTPAQLKQLFQAFNGHFLTIVQHRFASHCCETLLLQCAPEVTKELDPEYMEAAAKAAGVDAVFSSMEGLFLHMLAELEPAIISLLSDRFASHTVRVLLLILSGRPVSSARSLVQSRKKENIPSTTASNTAAAEASDTVVPVPNSFHDALKNVLTIITRDISTPELRSMAVHQIGSPTLQVVLRLEFGLSQKERKAREKSEVGTLFTKLVGGGKKEAAEDKEREEKKEEEEGDDKDANSFFQNLLYDSVGSHLAESLVQYTPRREFKILYNKFMGPRIGSLARNETAAFVVQRALERMTKEELEEALKEIIPQIPGLVERNRVAILKTLIDTSSAHKLDISSLSTTILSAYSIDASDPSDFIFRLLHIPKTKLPPFPAPSNDTTTTTTTQKPKLDPITLHGSLLAQSILSSSSPLSTALTSSLLSQPPATLLSLATHPQASHVVQKALATSLPTLKRIMHSFRTHWADLALSQIGSHIVDTCWSSGAPMNLRQEVAAELLAREPELRESYYGRAVWRNWGMDKYKTNRRLWFQLVKGEMEGKDAGDGGKDGGRDGGGGGGGGGGGRKKTAIELARERFAAKKAAGEGTGANAAAAGKAAEWKGPKGRKRALEVREDGGKKQKVK